MKDSRPTAVRFEPPAVSPAIAGVLLDVRVPARLISALLLDLERRGWIRSEPEKDQWALVSAKELPDASTLTSAERLLLNILFQPGLATDEGRTYGVQYVSATTCRRRLTGHEEEVLTALGDDIVAASLVEKNPLAKGRLGGRGKLVPTPSGQTLAEQARGFKQYLERAEVPSLTVDEAQGYVQRNLPHAIAFDIAGRWQQALQRSENTSPGATQLLATLRQQPLAVGALAGVSHGEIGEAVFTLSVAQNLFPKGSRR